jgi:hypothetical protein
MGLVVEGSLPAISICRQPAGVRGSGLVTSCTSSKPCPAHAGRPRSDSGRSAILHRRVAPPRCPQGQARSPVSYSKYVHELVELRDSNPGPLACHQQAVRPLASIPAGHRPGASTKIRLRPGRLRYFDAVPLSQLANDTSARTACVLWAGQPGTICSVRGPRAIEDLP